MKIKILTLAILLLSVCMAYSQNKDELRLDFNSRKQMYGYRNYKNKLVIKHYYTFAELFKEGLAVIENELNFGYINQKGEVVIDLKFKDAGSFSEGLAYFSNDLKKYGYINKKGETVIEPEFDGAFGFKNGLAIVQKINKDTIKYGDIPYLQGLIDKYGKLVGNQWFSFILSPGDSTCLVTIKKEDYTFDLISGKLEKAKSDENKNDDITVIVEKMPEFPGGELGLRKFIASKVRYPVSARWAGIEGKTYTRFAVSKTGEIINVKSALRVHPILDKESIRVIKELPRWTPGMKDGKTVTVWYTVPINFQLD